MNDLDDLLEDVLNDNKTVPNFKNPDVLGKIKSELLLDEYEQEAIDAREKFSESMLETKKMLFETSAKPHSSSTGGLTPVNQADQVQ